MQVADLNGVVSQQKRQLFTKGAAFLSRRMIGRIRESVIYVYLAPSAAAGCACQLDNRLSRFAERSGPLRFQIL
ncbi:hypothetical protein DESC_290057 [Desulfosarcina cetonica]|nr:hypothetical protein DESC_290057 [Desulfosarcina cetonica]